MTEIDKIRRILDFDSQTLNFFSNNEIVINFIKSKFGAMSFSNARILLRLLISGRNIISIQSFKKGGARIYQYNKSKFEKTSKDNKDVILLDETYKQKLLIELDDFLRQMIGEESDEIISDEDIEKHSKSNKENISTPINKGTYYEKFRKDVCVDNLTDFAYNFKKADLITEPPKNSLLLQRCNIHIVSLPIRFHYPTQYKYHCSFCGHDMEAYPYEVASTGNKVKCAGTITNQNTGNISICKTSLSPDEEMCITTQAYYYDINYEDENGRKHSGSAISFVNLDPGFYNCVLFSIRGAKKTDYFHILDVEEIQSNKFNFPEVVDNEHYLITLVKAFDKYIREQSGVEIYGLYPIKIALILQKLFSVFGMKRVGNIQIVGDPSTGKSLILKYYGFLLNSTFNLSTNGLSISVPGMRGSYHSINILGKDVKVVTTGHLGTYTSIHIDEAGENRELITNLKPFLLDENYSYDKVGGAGITNKRTAHVNISENLDHSHVGQYRGAIRKTYREINYKIGDEEKEEWNENWDLHLPMFMYENPYLRKVIKEKRLEYMQKQTFWIDGYDYALHERFPFYFYLVTNKDNTILLKTIRDNLKRATISENIELLRALKSDDINNYFNNINAKDEDENKNVEAFKVVDKIIEEYGFNFDVRTKSFFYQLIRTCKLINQKEDYTEEDFNIVRYFLETTNRKIDVVDTNKFSVIGPPSFDKEKLLDEQIESTKIEDNDEFGIQDGEFDEF